MRSHSLGPGEQSQSRTSTRGRSRSPSRDEMRSQKQISGQLANESRVEAVFKERCHRLQRQLANLVASVRLLTREKSWAEARVLALAGELQFL